MEAQFVTYTSCPVCGSAALNKAIIAKDNLVSEKEFEIWECADCTLRFTQYVPDSNSISQYYQSDNYISHSGTNKGLINSLYHAVRKITLSDKRRLIASVTQTDNGSLLDIGAGTGAFVSHMQLNGWQVTGLEPDESARKNALAVNNVDLLTPDTFFDFPPDSFEERYLLLCRITRAMMQAIIKISGQRTMFPATCIIFHRKQFFNC